MDNVDLKPLIKKAIHAHSDDERVELVIRDVLQEVLQEQYHSGRDWKKRFDTRFKDSILYHFRENIDNE